jgi:cysteine desulfurase
VIQRAPHLPQRRIYLDYNATTPVDERVAAAMMESLRWFGNPSSAHGFGREARELVDTARQETADLIHAAPEEIVFTASGSEGNNLALLGAAAGWDGPSHVITSRIEHSAVLECCRRLETLGHDVTYLPVDRGGRVCPDELRRRLRPNTRLISIMHANNETGVLQPIEEIGAIAREAGVLLHCDACQSVGKAAVDVERMQVDLLTFSAHKIYGPKGIGALYVRTETPLEPIVRGGSQEAGLRAGTENVLGIVGLGAACRLAAEAPHEEHARLRRLRDRLRDGLLAWGDVSINGDLRLATPTTLNVSFHHIKGDALAAVLSYQGIAVSTGSACHAHETKPSHVLAALGLDSDRLAGAVRFSLGRMTTAEEIDEALTVIREGVRRLRAMSPLARSA